MIIIKNRIYLEVMQLKSIFMLLNDQHCHRVDSKEGGYFSQLNWIQSPFYKYYLIKNRDSVIKNYNKVIYL